MPRSRQHSRNHPPRERWTESASVILTALAAITLSIPCFSFTYLWDDFDFLERAQHFRLAHLLPDPAVVFYRPLSREVYFTALETLGKSRLVLGHIGNAILLGLAVALVVVVTRRLVGMRAGILAGSAFAALGALPVLVGWLSGAQDFLAIVFVLLALHWRGGKRDGLAILALAAALLSKEVALAAIPFLAALPWLEGAKPPRAWRSVTPYLLLVAVWIAIHPGIQLLLHRTAGSGAGGYVQVGAPGRGEFLARSLLTLANLPVTGSETRWPSGLGAVTVLAGVLLSIAILASSPSRARKQPRTTTNASPRALALQAALFAALATLLTAALVRRWSPYYSAMPAVGTSILLGIALDRIPAAGALPLVLAFLGMGTWSRGTTEDPATTTERNLEVTSDALERVRMGFASIRPTMPRRTQALLSVAGTGAQSIPIHLQRYQALKVWYDDPGLESRAAERRKAWNGPEILFRVTPGLDVIEIETEPIGYRSSGGPPGPGEIDRPIRAYARGLAASGEPDRAVRLFLSLEAADSPTLKPYDRRLAAMVLYRARRAAEANRLLAGVPVYPREIAIDMITKILIERPGAPEATDSTAFLAFGVAQDAEAFRKIMRKADHVRDAVLASYAARQVLRHAPGDSEATGLLQKIARTPAPQRITEPGVDLNP